MSEPLAITSSLSHLTFRELLANRARARRAVSRGRNRASSQRLLSEIEAELESRKQRKADRLYGGLPRIAALDY
ncbi:hypothetical protein [Ahrensia sp. R2A130]|uniref:hypothetical protein n=1 Tax=Ahrensia sp. R2A130 TaxID=744979 RepID=UPI0001E0A45D|nr:hypothetical protein [Ahrensia sp. R2A130]EFL89639.1 conserved hypothetical protein [Ahrensia sp. R2A130]